MTGEAANSESLPVPSGTRATSLDFELEDAERVTSEGLLAVSKVHEQVAEPRDTCELVDLRLTSLSSLHMMPVAKEESSRNALKLKLRTPIMAVKHVHVESVRGEPFPCLGRDCTIGNNCGPTFAQVCFDYNFQASRHHLQGELGIVAD